MAPLPKVSLAGRWFLNGKSYDWQVRQGVVLAWLEHPNASWRELADITKVCKDTCRIYIEDLINDGTLYDLPRGGVQISPPKLQAPELNYLTFLHALKADLSLQEYANRLRLDMGITVSGATVCRALAWLQLTRKRRINNLNWRKFLQVNMEHYAAFVNFMFSLKARDIINFDCMGFHTNSGQRRFARAFAGTQAPNDSPDDDEIHYNLYAAVSPLYGALPCTYISAEPTTCASIEAYFEVMLTCAAMYAPAAKVVLLDNAKVHSKPRLAAIAAAHGFQLLFLPRYAPELAFVELVFAWAKKQVRKDPFRSMLDIVPAFADAMADVPAAHVARYAEHCGWAL